MIHSALTLTAAGAYRPFGEIGAACLPPVAARHGRAATRDHQRELGERLRGCPPTPTPQPRYASCAPPGWAWSRSPTAPQRSRKTSCATPGSVT